MQGQPGPHCEVLLQTQTKQANRMGTLNVYIVMDLRASSSGKSPGHCVALDNGHRCPESIFERKKKIIALSLPASKWSSWGSRSTHSSWVL